MLKKDQRKRARSSKLGRNKVKCEKYRAKHGGVGTKAGKNKIRKSR